MSSLQEFLTIKKRQIEQIHVEVAKRLKEEAESPTDEHLQDTVDNLFFKDRYVLVLPDGSRWGDVPGYRFIQSGFHQRPAALKQAGRLAGCRVFDTKEGMFIND